MMRMNVNWFRLRFRRFDAGSALCRGRGAGYSCCVGSVRGARKRPEQTLMTAVPLLRAPPFPGRPVIVARPASGPGQLPQHILDAIRHARVGGAYWAAPAALCRMPDVVLRPRTDAEIETLAAEHGGEGALWVTGRAAARRVAVREGGQWCDVVDPWSVLEGGALLVAHGDDEWVALAAIIGAPVKLLSDGQYGRRGEERAALVGRVRASLAAMDYLDPFDGRAVTIEAVIDQLADWRRIIAANRPIVAAFGMAWWKRREIRRFLWVPGRRLPIVRRAGQAIRIAAQRSGSIAIWPSRAAAIETAARQQRASGGRISELFRPELVRVEDGFVRSVGLGSNLVPPSSVVVDHRGIHFDPSGPSDLEHILSCEQFTPPLLTRAASLRRTIVGAQISKYGALAPTAAPSRTPGRRLVLVPAQVEDDMSVLAGGGGLSSNFEFLRRTRALEPEAEIWFRPHPDVDAGHRKGAVPDTEVLAIADRIVREPSMAALLETVDAVHVITSLTGFEALMRGREVICHGTPFYSGWGLTRDLGAVPERRGRQLSLDELVAGVLILYPRYLDPVTGLPCPPETLIERMTSRRMRSGMEWLQPLRQWQGRIMAKWR
jgi:capsular polysaccharide export protein